MLESWGLRLICAGHHAARPERGEAPRHSACTSSMDLLLEISSSAEELAAASAPVLSVSSTFSEAFVSKSPPKAASNSASRALDMWTRNKKHWQARHLISPGDKERGSWLSDRCSKGKWGVGCCVCAGIYENSWATYGVDNVDMLRTCRFQKHEQSQQHQRALNQLLGDASPGAPSIDDFQTVLSARRAAVMSETTSREKTDKMAWCLKEAVGRMERQDVKTCTTFGVHQDGSQSRHCVRYVAVNTKLSVYHGLLGVQRDGGTDALAVCQMTVDTLIEFCTAFTGAPRSIKVSPIFDEPLFQHISEHMHMFNADGASDETRTGRMLGQTAFPNLKFRLRDKTHAARRLISKPTGADPFLQATFDLFIGAKGSLTKTIENSPAIRAMFHKHCATAENVQDCSHVRRLKYSKVRYDSCAAPTGRFVVWFDALVALALELVASRTGTPAARAEAFLLAISDDLAVEQLIQLGMLADGADESMGPIRALDDDNYDVAEIPALLQLYTQKLDMMYVSKGCLTTGFTALMLENVTRPRIVTLKGTPRSIGGPEAVKDETVQRCLNRMIAWTVLVRQSLRAEFPCWEIWHAFEAFDLSLHRRALVDDGRKLRGGQARARHLNKLAQVFGVDAANLALEYDDHVVHAANLYKVGEGMRSVDCWREALLRTQSRESMRTRHPARNLLPVLQGYCLFCGCCTAGAERCFGLVRRLITPQRGSISGPRENEVLILSSASGRFSDDSIIANAREIWRDVCGAERASGDNRLRNNFIGCIRKVRAGADTSERAFLKRRRDAVATMLDATDSRPIATSTKAGAEWTADHETMRAKLRKIASTAKAHTHDEKGLLPTEITAKVTRAHEIMKVRNELNDMIYMAEKSARKLRMKPAEQKTALLKFLAGGMPVHVAEGLLQDAMASIQKYSMHVVGESRLHAQIYVATNPLSPGQRTDWAARLSGGQVVVPCFLGKRRHERLRNRLETSDSNPSLNMDLGRLRHRTSLARNHRARSNEP